eukprot:TRINITY_DN13058_c0_g2_i1.p1 TRINITY_DN13058_c0_g2~~TRINITY_DN13058_c0_g2_i1.p1  ORF type:complete len:306 (-),score=67.45 TRINITY_DN13058_c0_g2_i1:229-1146(-)
MYLRQPCGVTFATLVAVRHQHCLVLRGGANFHSVAAQQKAAAKADGALRLSDAERDLFSRRCLSIAEKHPAVARLLLRQMNEVEYQDREKIDLAAVCKVARAKKARLSGQGKTMLFAYLSLADKARVLKLTGASGAEEVGARKSGKTAFFAALPGPVKYDALRAWQQERDSADRHEQSSAPPTNQQLLRLAMINGAPMVGFGFADNFLMIVFGASIDAHLGMYFTTLAAAGLGNLMSNIVGLGLADYIEHGATRFGFPDPQLSSTQRAMLSARVAGVSGTIFGVTVGCLLGMAPLLMLPHDEDII